MDRKKIELIPIDCPLDPNFPGWGTPTSTSISTSTGGSTSVGW